MDRRQYLGFLTAMSSGGCLQLTTTTPKTPDRETAPTALLPPVPEEMGSHHHVHMTVPDIEAEVGAFRQYNGDAGTRYYAEVLRWPSEHSARDGVELYRSTGAEATEWRVYVSNGVFSWAGTEVRGNVDRLITLLGSAEGLTSAYVRSTNQLRA